MERIDRVAPPSWRLDRGHPALGFSLWQRGTKGDFK